MRKFIVTLPFFLCFFLVYNLLGNRFANSEPYDVVESYIESRPELLVALGEIEEYGLSGRNVIGYENGKWMASFNIKIFGKKESGNLYTKLESLDNEKWEIVVTKLEIK